jgi:glycosyltransferase involved in cell wall biosynthesis
MTLAQRIEQPPGHVLRVLHVYRTYFPDPQGGVQEAIRQICRATQPFGVEHRIFTVSPNPEPRCLSREEAEVWRFQQHVEIASSGFSLSALPGFRRLVAWADLVHYHFPWPFGDVMHFLGQVRKPACVTYHSDIVRQQGLLWLYRPLMHRFLRRIDRIVATSPPYLASSQVLGKYREKTTVIPLGLDETSYAKTTPEALARMDNAYGRNYFLFIGVLRYYKGLNDLLTAIHGTRLRVVIAGEGPEAVRLRTRAQALGMDNVIFAGFVEDRDKPALIQRSRALVFPSNARSEAFGVTLLEGAMFSRPLICTEIGTGTTFVNRHGETGLVVPPAAPMALRQAMQRLADDNALAERFGHGARQRFEACFTAAAMGQGYAILYRELRSTCSAARQRRDLPAGV